MLHAKYIIYLTRTLFLNKKSLCFCDFFFLFSFRRNPCIVDQKFLLATLAECGNH